MEKIEYTITPNSINFNKFIAQCDAEEGIPDPISIAISNDNVILYLYFNNELSPEERQALDALIAAHDPEILVTAKQDKCKEIDKRTAELVEEGFVYDNIVFSGSLKSQSRVMAAFLAKDLATYPIRWMSKDDTSFVDIQDATMMSSFFLIGFGTLKAKIDLGSNLKILVNAATTIAEVEAINDPR